MTWQPGVPVRTDQDRREWETWRRDRKRQQQRERRARYPRIDYYPDPAATEVIARLWSHRVGCNLSSVINRIIAEWTDAATGIKKGGLQS
jgi:hypothetical protein